MIKKTKRIESLDYLRGGMAFLVMCYHYVMFSKIDYFDFILDKFGIYAVSTFYMLSGLSLALAYHHKINTLSDVSSFFIKRIFRILPLMWIAISLALFFAWAGDTSIPSFTKIILNYTLLFPIFDIKGYIPTGAWSIGNEIIFYLFFPILIFLVDKNKTIFMILVFTALYFAFYLIDNSIDLGNQWRYYINHFNQIYFFISGIIIFMFFKSYRYKNRKVIYFLFFSIILIILLVPFNKTIDLVTQWNRIYYSILFILLTCIFYIGIQPIKNFIGISFKFLGEVSYSIYLLPPLVAIPVVYILERFDISTVVAHFLVALPLTLMISYIVYRYFERPMMSFGKKLTIKLREKSNEY